MIIVGVSSPCMVCFPQVAFFCLFVLVSVFLKRCSPPMSGGTWLSTHKSRSHGETDRKPAFGHGWGLVTVVLLKSAPAGLQCWETLMLVSWRVQVSPAI